MTYAVVPALRYNTELADIYEPLLTSRTYDPELKVPATKAGITAGMSMTEKQGGSDVRAGTTQATPNADGSYRLTGHKWFTSAPMCDVFLVLAQAPGGLSCFFLPRVLPDGTRNRMFLQRLKDKLGNHANASSEVEYDGATAWLVGEEGRGVPTIIEMVNLTRLDCTLGSATSMRTGADPRHPPRPASKGVRRLPDRPAADAQRARRSRRRGRGRDHRWRCGWPVPPTARCAATSASRCCAASAWRQASTGCASARPATPPRRWNASAATATSRSPACRGCTARRR